MAKLGSFGPAKVSVDGGKTWFDVPNISIGIAAKADPSYVIQEVALVASVQAPALGSLPQIVAACTAYTHQDDDAHDTCTLTACLNPLHPGPCKGWKGTLHSVSPGAWHALEAARVEKANHRRLQRIEELKSKGLPVPKKLLVPVVAKPHPDAGKTANTATGEAHAAGKAVSEAAGVHVKEPGKVTLGQAVKSHPFYGKPAPQNTGEKGPKGKKPTVASKGIAFVIAQEKVTPQYKLDKASTITPEQWNALSDADKTVIRNELAHIQKEGFGPQQKKATELISKFGEHDLKAKIEKAHAKAPEAPVPSKAEVKLGAKHEAKVSAHEAKIKAAEEKLAEVKAKLAAHEAKPKLTETHTPNLPKTQASTLETIQQQGKIEPGVQAPGVHLNALGPLKKAGLVEYKKEPDGKTYVVPTKLSEVATPNTAVASSPTVSMTPTNVAKKIQKDGSADLVIGGKTVKVGFESSDHPGKLTMTPGGGYTVTTPDGEKVHFAKGQHVTVMHSTSDVPKTAAPTVKIENKAEKPKDLPKHVQDAIAMAKGQAPGATWSKNHLAAYQPLTAEEFHALPKDVQSKIVDELGKGQSKFLDPKKIAAAKALLENFGHGEGKKVAPPKIEKADLSAHMHDHNVTQAQAKQAVAEVPTSSHYLITKKLVGLNETENPDNPAILKAADTAAKTLVENKTKLYGPEVLNHPDVKAATAAYHKALTDSLHAHAVADAKKQAFNKIHLKLANDHGELSPIEKATLQAYQQHILSHTVPATRAVHLDALKQDVTKTAHALDAKLHDTLKTVNAPKPENMSPAQIADRAAELLGPEAVKPQVTLNLGEMQHLSTEGKATAKAEAAKYSPETLTEPTVASKYQALASVHTQLAASQAEQKKLDDHLAFTHGHALSVGVDQYGNPLSVADKKIVSLHAAQLKNYYAHLAATQKHQQAKLGLIQEQFHAAAAKAQGNLKPAEPHKLTDYDQAQILQAYSGAWSKQAQSTITYGIKTYGMKQTMKAHPQYPALTQDLDGLKHLAGEVALTHAAEHQAKLNVPAHPDTGEFEPGAEKQAWEAAVKDRWAAEKKFKDAHAEAQKKLDTIRADLGLKKRNLPKADAAAVKAAAAEHGYYKSGAYSGPNYGKPAVAKNYMLAKVGPNHAVLHKTAAEKKLEKLGAPASKASSTSKIENAAPVKLGDTDSTVAHIPDPLKKQITSDFKGMPNGKYLADPAPDIFDNLVTLAAAHGKNTPGGLSVDQVLKTIDETHSKNLGVANSGMLHSKLTEWLGTAAGKAYAESHSAPDANKVKQLTGEVALPKGVTLEPGQKVQPLAGPGAHDESLKASSFKGHTSAEAQAEQDAYKKAQGITWTAEQKKAMKAYTGNGSQAYTGINNYLRGEGSYDQVVKQYAVDIQSAMMPLREHTLLKRGTGWPPGIASYQSHPQDLLGKTFEDAGFTSSSVAGSGGHFSGQPLQLIIEAPKGTPAVFVNGISHYKDSENEMLLAAGTKFKVLSVDKTSGGHTLLRVRVVGGK